MSKQLEQEKQLEQLKALKEGFNIGDRRYDLGKMPFKVGRKILAYVTVVGEDIDKGHLGFIDTPKFENEIEPLLIKYTNVNDFELSKIPDHFEEHPSDYAQFVCMSLQGFAAVFMPESNTSSQSTSKEEAPVTLRKPM